MGRLLRVDLLVCGSVLYWFPGFGLRILCLCAVLIVLF